MMPKTILTRLAQLCAMALLALWGARVAIAQKLEVEVVTLRDGGFFPSKITRPAGPFLLAIRNRSHADQIQPGLTRSDGSVTVAAEPVTDPRPGYVLNLPANTYVLKDSAHPNWVPLTIVTR